MSRQGCPRKPLAGPVRPAGVRLTPRDASPSALQSGYFAWPAHVSVQMHPQEFQVYIGLWARCSPQPRRRHARRSPRPRAGRLLGVARYHVADALPSRTEAALLKSSRRRGSGSHVSSPGLDARHRPETQFAGGVATRVRHLPHARVPIRAFGLMPLRRYDPTPEVRRFLRLSSGRQPRSPRVAVSA